jgi:hypothetical protein
MVGAISDYWTGEQREIDHKIYLAASQPRFGGLKRVTRLQAADAASVEATGWHGGTMPGCSAPRSSATARRARARYKRNRACISQA